MTKRQPKYQRRVPVCTINWCCPYRSDLCRGSRCIGARIPRDAAMIIEDDHHVLIRDGVDSFVRYAIPEKTREAFLGFDRGDPAESMVGEYTFEAPKTAAAKETAR